MKGRDIPMEEKNNNTVYQLQPKLLVTNFNFDAMAATVTQSGTSFKNTGVFRTKSDLVGMSWFTRDTLSRELPPQRRSFSRREDAGRCHRHGRKYCARL